MLILIAGKQASLRNALKTLLLTRPGFEISGTVGDKKDLFAHIEIHQPDLLLLDENFSRELVEEVIVPLQQGNPFLATVVLGGRRETKQAYLDAGAMAVVNKGDPPKSLLTAIEEIRLYKNHV